MTYGYTLYIDEAGDDKTEALLPDFPSGNSEWLCIGGYLIRAQYEDQMDSRPDSLLRRIGGQPGNTLHYRNLKPKNRIKICEELSEHSARAFVVCSYKKTIVGHHNAKAASKGNASSNRQYLYNFVVRLLLERVTEFVEEDAKNNGAADPIIRVVLASRKGHHFGHFKAYVLQLINQAVGGSTYLKTKEVKPHILRYHLIDRAPASALAGLQLADCIVSAVFQSIERSSPTFPSQPATHLKPIIAGKKSGPNSALLRRNMGITLFPPRKAPTFLNSEQEAFFRFYGYNFDRVDR